MEKIFIFLKSKIQYIKFVYIVILIFLHISCNKENDSKIDFKIITNNITYYPDKYISLTFYIEPEGNNGPYKLKWFVPDSLKEVGPYTININSNISLDFEIIDSQNTSKRFTYIINTDTLDSLKYDYRNKYVGKYSCNVTYSYSGSTNYYTDTLTVVKNNTFNIINIQNKNDIINKYEGNKMTYLNSNGYNSYPTGSFYGYHSDVLLTNDSIYYRTSGPLGFYYTTLYKGIKINKK